MRIRYCFGDYFEQFSKSRPQSVNKNKEVAEFEAPFVQSAHNFVLTIGQVSRKTFAQGTGGRGVYTRNTVKGRLPLRV